MVALATAFVEVRANTSRIRDDVTGGMKGAEDVAKSQGSRFGSLFSAAAGAAAATGAVQFARASIDAYKDAEASQNRLAEAFARFPALADTNQAALQDLNAELMNKTRFDDDALASGQAMLAQFGLTGQQVGQLTPLLADFAAKTGQDAPAAAEQLGKALFGQGRALKSVGIDFQDAGSVGANFDQIMVGLRTQVGGFAESEGKTAAGQAAILGNQFGELQETVGSVLLPVLQRMAGVLLDGVKWMGEHQTLTIALGASLAALAVTVGAVNAAQSIYAAGQAIVRGATIAWTGAQWLLNAALTANPIGLVVVGIAALVAALVLAWNNSETFRAVVTAAWEGVKRAVAAVVDWFVGTAWPFLQRVWEAIAAGAMWLWQNVIAPAWAGIQAAVSVVVSWLVGTAWPFLQGVFNAIGAIATWLWQNIFVPVWNGIRVAVDAFWQFFSKIIWPAMQITFQAVAAIAMWLWQNVFSPVWAGISAVVSAAWTFISGIFQAIYDRVAGPLAAIFFWLRDKVFDPVFGTIQTIVANAAKFIGEKWDAIRGFFLAPIKFMLDVVVNKGIVGGFNWIAEKLNISTRLEPVFIDGVNRATGGIIPGSSPTRTADNIPVWATAGEFMEPVDSVRYYGVGVMEAMRRRAIPREVFQGLADGGMVLDKNAIAAAMRMAGWPASLINEGAAIAMAESSGRVGVVNPIGARGLWQIMPVHGPMSMTDPVDQARKALEVYRRAGNSWRPWEVYTTGAFRRFLGDEQSGISRVGEFLGEVWQKLQDFLSNPLGAFKDAAASIAGNYAKWGEVASGFVSRVGSTVVEKAKELFSSMLGGFGPAEAVGGRVNLAGGQLDESTYRKIVAALGTSWRLFQGSWSTRVAASAGTHAGAGVADIGPANAGLSFPAMEAALRGQGLAAWFRNWPGNLHIHLVNPAVYDALSPQAKSQVEAYRRGGSGLAGGMAAGGLVKMPKFDSGGVLAPGVNTVYNGTGRPEPLVRADEPVRITGTLEIGGDGLARIIDGRLSRVGRMAAVGRRTV